MKQVQAQMKGKAEVKRRPRTREERRRARLEWRRRNLPRSARLRARREQLGLSARDAADLAGIPPGTWKGYETGWNPVPAHRLEAVARALRCSIDWLVTGIGDVATRDGAA